MGLFDIFSADAGISAANKARQEQEDAAKQGFKKGKKLYTKGLRKAEGSYAAGLAPLEAIFNQNQSAEKLRLDALGVNGPEAAAAARASFQESPGSQYAQDTASQNILRNQAAAGGLRSGQTATDLNDYSQNYAFNQQWQPWLQGLGMRDPGQSARDQATVLQNLGNLQEGGGRFTAGLATNKFDKLGQAGAQYQQDIFGAKQGALGNQWGAIGAGLGLGSKLLGLGFG